jgi:nucleoside permease NupC
MPSKSLSPIISLVTGHLFMIGIVLSFYLFGFYEENEYFQWGPPVTFFSHVIETDFVFYSLMAIIFIHQIITNWIYEVVYPWIINTLQNRQNKTIEYSNITSLIIVNGNSLYGQLHLAFLINGLTSQISFLLVLILADVITLTYINWQYLKQKNTEEEIEEIEEEIEENEENEKKEINM